MKEDLKKLDGIFNTNLMKEWLIFREEEISTMNEEDKKYLIHFDEHFENVLKKVSKEDYRYVKEQLDHVYDRFMDYSSHWNEKYYFTGFADALKMIVGAFSEK